MRKRKYQFLASIYGYIITALLCIAVVLIAIDSYVNNNTEENTIDDSAYLTYIEDHPELTLKYINYNSDSHANIAYNVGTRVIYSVSMDGTISPLYTSDGMLMLYQDETGVISVSK